jgi:hypothetical protein
MKVQTNDGALFDIVPDEITLFEGADDMDEVFPLYNVSSEMMKEIIKFMDIEREEFALNIVYGDMKKMVRNPAYAELADSWFAAKPYAEYFIQINNVATYLGYDRLLKLLHIKYASVSYNLKLEEVCWVLKNDEKRLPYYRKVLKEKYFKLPEPIPQKADETPDERRHRLAVKYDIENRRHVLKDCLVMDPFKDYDDVMRNDAFALSMLEKGKNNLMEKIKKGMVSASVSAMFSGTTETVECGAGAGAGAPPSASVKSTETVACGAGAGAPMDEE